MPRERRRSARLVSTTVGAALLVSACASPRAGSPAVRTTPAYVPSGTLLLDLGGFDQRLVTYELPRGPVHDVIRREGGQGFFGFRFGAAWGPGGSVYALSSVNFGLIPDVELTRVTPAGRTTRLGSILHGGIGFAFRDHYAVTWTCAVHKGQVYVMDVIAQHPAWTSVAQGCEASISPDGKTLAYVQGPVIWTQPVEGGAPTKLLDMRSVHALPSLGIERIRPNFAPTVLGEDGAVAVTIGSQADGWAIVVAQPGHQPQVIAVGTNEPRGLGWQPGGHLLAFADFVAQSQIVELRIFDPSTGRTTTVSATLDFGAFAWAPDGSVLAVSRNSAIMGFVDPRSGLVGTAPVPGAPDDWVA